MNNKLKLFRFMVVLGFFSLYGVVQAQSNTSQEEALVSFSSIVKVNLDSSVDVDEIITYTTGAVAHHGIYRDIRPVSSVGGKMKISAVKVVDENENLYNFVFSNNGDFVRIKIGDANVTFSGQKIYHISYHATNAVAHLKDIDEIYWNATGNEWSMPIYEAKATVILPSGVTSTQNACYFGIQSSTEKCQLNSTSTEATYVFDSPRKLHGGEGLTIAVGFPKGVVAAYQESFVDIYGGLIGGIAITFASFVVMFTYWFRNWRDPKGIGIIVPQYDVPDGLTPMEVDGIVNERIDSKSISAEIIYLATLGYLKIKQTEEKTIFGFSLPDYEFTMLKKIDLFSENKDSSESVLFYGIFRFDDEINSNNKLSNLKNIFYPKIKIIIKNVANNLLNKGYYKNLGKILYMPQAGTLISLILFGFIVSGISGLITESLSVFMGIISITIFLPVFWYLSPAKTEKGVAIKEYLLGLKMYLQIAEKDRLAFHNAPEKKPEIFEKLLPYAMVLGVEKAWAKEFEDMYTTPPSWYEGTEGSDFSTLTFSKSLSNFSSTTSTNLSSTPSSSGSSGDSGSGGGGSSGGGGGGGGGGSW